MQRIQLSDFAEQHGQTEAARMLGMTQGALNKALKVGREVHVTKQDDGTYTAQEVRQFPSQQKKSVA